MSREFDYNYGKDYMTITLPSGRKLYYNSPAIGENRWGNPSISYMGMEQTKKKWTRIETYGGKLVENVVQAIARDCLAHSIEKVERAGYRVIFHIHDEVCIECDADKASLDDVTRIMSEPVPWAPTLPLNAEGWVGQFFKKD